MISLIVACAKNNVIGNKGRIPWDLPEDRQRFKELTLGSVVIMGRRTFAEIFEKFGKGLPGRETIVISGTQNYDGENYRTVATLPAAIEFAQNHFPKKEIFICGGEQVYREAIEKKLVKKMYITKVNLEVEGDTFFPDFDEKDFDVVYFS